MASIAAYCAEEVEVASDLYVIMCGGWIDHAGMCVTINIHIVIRLFSLINNYINDSEVSKECTYPVISIQSNINGPLKI